MMIVDRLDHGARIFSGRELTPVLNYLLDLTPHAEDGEYPLAGDRIFARVMSYRTKAVQECALEAHREYVDIQMVLAGAEGIEWFPTHGLQVKKSYDPATDVEFYTPPEKSLARVDLYPGLFALFFPHDAHMPQIAVAHRPELIKKVVVKIRREVFTSQQGVF